MVISTFLVTSTPKLIFVDPLKGYFTININEQQYNLNSSSIVVKKYFNVNISSDVIQYIDPVNFLEFPVRTDCIFSFEEGRIYHIVQDSDGYFYINLTLGSDISVKFEVGTQDLTNITDFYGFPKVLETNISFNETTRDFTISPIITNWSYYKAGIKYTVTGSKTINIPNIPNIYYITINDNIGTLQQTIIPWNLKDQLVLIAMIVFNDNLTPKYFMADERHTNLISRSDHHYYHTKEGTKFLSGGMLNNYNVNPIIKSNDNNTFGVDQTFIQDEDLSITLDSLLPNNYIIFIENLQINGIGNDLLCLIII